MSTSHQRRPSAEPSVVVRNVDGRRIVSRSNPEISYAYGAPAAANTGTNNRKRRTTQDRETEEPEPTSAADEADGAQPDARARYQALKKRKMQEASEKEQGKQDGSPTKKKAGRKSQRQATASAEPPMTSVAEEPMASSHAAESDDLSSAARHQRITSPGVSRSVLHGQLNSFYMDRDASTTDELDLASGNEVPSSILLGAQRQGLDLPTIAPDLDSIHSSDVLDSRSRDYAELQREADLLAEAEGSSVSGSVQGFPSLKNGGFKGKGKSNRTTERALQPELNGIVEENDAEQSGEERKHSQSTTGNARPGSQQSGKEATKEMRQPKTVLRRHSQSRIPWAFVIMVGTMAALLFSLHKLAQTDLTAFSYLPSNSTLGDKALRSRVSVLEKRLGQAERQVHDFERQMADAKAIADRVTETAKKLPAEVALRRDKSDGQLKLDANTLRDLKKMFVQKGDDLRSWEAFRKANEAALRTLTASVVADEARGGKVISRATFVDLLQKELDKLKSVMEARFNENAQGMQNDILAKVRSQQEMFERSGSWKKAQSGGGSQQTLPDLGAARDSIKAMIDDALETYSADRIGERDFALYSTGARVIPSFTSPTYGTLSGSKSWLSWPGGQSMIQRLGAEGKPPVIALMPDSTPGMCWAFAGSEGQLGISLARRTVVTKVSLEHTPASISHESGISAPRDVTMWGIVERPADVKRLATYRLEQATKTDLEAEGDDMAPTPSPPSDRHLLLASFTYDAFAPRAVQTFPASREALQLQIPVAAVQVHIHSNHGKPEYTCLYRARIHGREWTAENESAAQEGA